LALLGATALLYLWGLGASGWANSFYAAAVQAATQSWKAFFFGSSDAANSITVDKPPASLWVMAVSARIFGVNAWSLLVPQALGGVAAVGLLYATVRRWFSPGAALLAGAVLALTPVATLMFRFDNPDALLTLTLVAGAYCVVRATERASTRWLALAGVCVGLGFLTKMLQAFLVLPAFALVYLVAAPMPLRRRLGQLVVAGLALVASAGWWVAIVELWPASSRPYIGGSQNNSVLELILGYNGLGRLTGEEVGSVTGVPAGGNGGGMWGQTGWSRLFDNEIGGQIAWLVPAALLFLGALLWLGRRAPRTDRTRAALLLWGGWLLVTGLVFSYMQGIFHAYYAVALAPAVGALVGIGAAELWRDRQRLWIRAVLAAALVVTAVWAYALLGRAADWLPWLRVAVLGLGLVTAVALLFAQFARRAALLVAGAALIVGLAAPAAYSVQTASTAHSGAIVTAGPAVAGGLGGGPGGRRAGFAPGGQARGAIPGGPPGGALGQRAPNGTGPQGGQPNQGGNMGGLLRGSTASAELVALLERDADRYTWVAATVGSNSASGYQLATGDPVMPIGGFNGSDPSPTLERFQQYVRDARIHYFLGGGIGGNSNGGSNTSSQISQWVQENFEATTVGGVTVYDLTSTAGGTAT
jgi:4-amino-4-deoxy-L-arabinose transferase-like glycosyltransferase